MKKICVYAISKNEIKFVERWFESVKEADYVCVLDTGSTDGTYEKLNELGVICAQKTYEQFRFDVARNDSQKLIPADAEICVCVDIDEVFESGWAQLVRDNWRDGTGRMRYRYTWNFNDDKSEGVVFLGDKIHKKDAYKWKHPVHEVLVPLSDQKLDYVTVDKIQLNHLADVTKSRSNYLPLLELSVKESPFDDRNVHYLGREYMFHKKYVEAIETLKYHLSLPSATWRDERGASLRFIARCYGCLGDTLTQETYYKLAILECPHTREAYFEYAVSLYHQKRYLDALVQFNEMLKISTRNLNYISSPECWSGEVFDYMSICYYNLNKPDDAIHYAYKALALNPTDARLKANLNLFLDNKKPEPLTIPDFLKM